MKFDIEKVFNDLNLSGWEKINDLANKRGGQACVLFVNHKDGREGAFRYFKDKSERTVKRFNRELKILTNPEYKHPCIVNILEHSSDDNAHWYISEKGDPFDEYREQLRKKLKDNPDELVIHTVQMIIKLLEGLGPLHENGIVHRDIKPGNLIIQYDNSEAHLVLIDFGLAHSEHEERLTLSDEAVGNIRFSPDQMMTRSEDVPAWWDVFMVSQLLIWMVRESTPKDHWTRPLDWRYVKYHPELSDNLLYSILAITALCSEQSLSPKDANEMLSLLKERFFLDVDKPEGDYQIDVTGIQEGAVRGKNKKDLEMVETHKVIETSFTAGITSIWENFRIELKKLFDECKQSGISVINPTDSSLDDFNQEVMTNRGPTKRFLYSLEFRGDGNKKFMIKIHCMAFSLGRYGGNKLPESSNMFTFLFMRSGPGAPSYNNEEFFWLTLERDGSLALRDEHMKEIKKVDIRSVIDRLKEWIEDPEIWEIMNRMA